MTDNATLLDTLLPITGSLQGTPLFLFDKTQKESFLSRIHTVVRSLKVKVDTEELKNTQIYQHLQDLDTHLNAQTADEFWIADHLNAVIGAIPPSAAGGKETEFVQLKQFVGHFHKRAAHHKTYSDIIQHECDLIDPQKRYTHDQQVAKQRLLFYVLEYTLQVAEEFRRLDAQNQPTLLEQGLVVPAGNLPALYPLMKSFHDEVIYAFCDSHIRENLLATFLEFETALATRHTETIIPALDKFNIGLLIIIKTLGIEKYSGIVYHPYADDTSVQDIIVSIEGRALSYGTR